MAKCLFVTATGTDVGKTYVSSLIVKKMREAGLNCGYYKPVLSGAGVGINDCEYVIKESGLNVQPQECLTYSFDEPVSPHLAAKRVNLKIEPHKILEDFEKHKKEYDYLLIEGAGGITTPLSQDYLLSDLIKDMNCDTLLVADAGLGTINSVVLTCEYATSKNINVSGIILNNYDENNFMHNDNNDFIESWAKIDVISKVKHNDKILEINIEELIKRFT